MERIRIRLVAVLVALTSSLLMAAPTASASVLPTIAASGAIARIAANSTMLAPSTSIRPEQRPKTPMPPTHLASDDVLCLAVAIYHEARSEPLEGQRAVASVILQRAAVSDRWGETPCTVVIPVQFSFLDENGDFEKITDLESWDVAYRVAREMKAQGPLPELKDADHYHTTGVDPTWNKQMDHINTIGDHIFWRDPSSRFLFS